MDILYSVIFFILGAALTSFLQLVSDRVPMKQSITGRSHCDHCGITLRGIDVIPIFGYLFTKGVCHSCKKRVNIAYPLLEVAGGMIFMFAYLYFGWQLELIVFLVMICVMLTETMSDIFHQIVIDSVWIVGAIIIVVIRIIQQSILPHLLSAAILFAMMFLIAYIGKLAYKKEALGGGDIKLYIFIGMVLTIWNGLISFFIASLVALVVAIIKRKATSSYIPLVPFIFIGVFLAYLYGDVIVAWYLSLF